MSDSGSGVGAALGISSLVGGCIGLLVMVFFIFVLWKIVSKTGYSGAMSLLVLIPGIGALILFCILAFGNWPVHEELERLRMERGGAPGFQPTFPPQQPPFPPQQPPYQGYPRY